MTGERPKVRPSRRRTPVPPSCSACARRCRRRRCARARSARSRRALRGLSPGLSPQSGEVPLPPPVAPHRVDVELALPRALEHDRPPVRAPGRVLVQRPVAGEAPPVRAVRPHHPDVAAARAHREEGDRASVRRPGRRPVGDAGALREVAGRAAARRDDHDVALVAAERLCAPAPPDGRAERGRDEGERDRTHAGTTTALAPRFRENARRRRSTRPAARPRAGARCARRCAAGGGRTQGRRGSRAPRRAASAGRSVR